MHLNSQSDIVVLQNQIQATSTVVAETKSTCWTGESEKQFEAIIVDINMRYYVARKYLRLPHAEIILLSIIVTSFVI